MRLVFHRRKALWQPLCWVVPEHTPYEAGILTPVGQGYEKERLLGEREQTNAATAVVMGASL